MFCLEQVAFEAPDGAKTDCPGVSWTFWLEPPGQRLGGAAPSAVAETQGEVEVADRVGGREKSRSPGQKLPRRHCVGEGRGEGLVKEGGREWYRVGCSRKCQ